MTLFAGDEMIPDAAMVYDRKRIIMAQPQQIFPWLVQLGKGRAGWYLPRSWERFSRHSWLAARSINPAWQDLQPGTIVADYGFSKDDYFCVASISPPDSLVYVSERLGTVFSWALLLHALPEGGTEVHLRFRGRIHKTGWRRRVLVWGGDWLDWVFTEPMLRGLEERVKEAQVAR